MKKLLYCLIALSILSCSKSELIIEDDFIKEEDYFLNFDFKYLIYTTGPQPSHEVVSIQNLEQPMTFLDVQKSIYKYSYFNKGDAHTDSIDIVGTIKFEADNNFGINGSTIYFEIIVREAKSSLNSISDSTYVYKTNSTLYNQLSKNNFGPKSMFGEPDRSIVLISIPSVEIFNDETYDYVYTTNGFYYDHEYINFTNIEFNQRENTILLDGGFEVDLKMLGCGIISSHYIENAEFKLKIK